MVNWKSHRPPRFYEKPAFVLWAQMMGVSLATYLALHFLLGI